MRGLARVLALFTAASMFLCVGRSHAQEQTAAPQPATPSSSANAAAQLHQVFSDYSLFLGKLKDEQSPASAVPAAVIDKKRAAVDARARQAENVSKQLSAKSIKVRRSALLNAQSLAAQADQDTTQWADLASRVSAPDAKAAAVSQAKLAKATTTGAKATLNQAVNPPGDVTFTDGGTLHYGPTVALLRLSTSRQANQPGRLRNYTPSLDVLPAEFGFQFVYHPVDTPWRLPLANHGWYQLFSVGGMLLAHVDTHEASRGAVSLVATLGVFEDALGFGFGVDLYRGIPVRGADGLAGSGTVYTGLLAPVLASEGELTPENVFGVLTLNLEWLTKTVAGQLK